MGGADMRWYSVRYTCIHCPRYLDWRVQVYNQVLKDINGARLEPKKLFLEPVVFTPTPFWGDLKGAILEVSKEECRITWFCWMMVVVPTSTRLQVP